MPKNWWFYRALTRLELFALAGVLKGQQAFLNRTEGWSCVGFSFID
jgi:hypothetical protein